MTRAAAWAGVVEWFAYRFLLGRCDWFWAIYFWYRCPYPVSADHSARACIRAGHCGCDNFEPFPTDDGGTT